MPEQSDYQQKKALYERMLTVYGRKAVLEALLDQGLQRHTLHLASSNRDSGIITDIKRHAREQGIPVKFHNREELSRISRNGKQDQGVALDILCPAFRNLENYLASKEHPDNTRLLALDGISNPQNLGMIIRSAAAGNIDGIILPRKGNAALGPLVIKASAGTVYQAPLLLCNSMPEALTSCQRAGAEICTLEADAPLSLFEHRHHGLCVYILGNETEGVSKSVSRQADTRLSVPMRNGVESLNVAVTASLIAYSNHFER